MIEGTGVTSTGDHLSALLETVERLEAGASNEFNSLLAQANIFFGTRFGIISRIAGDSYTIEHVDSNPASDALVAGQRFALGDTYCAITLMASDVVSLAHVGDTLHATHPCYQNTQLEAYIGAPILLDGEIYGTLNFSSPEPRAQGWSDQHRALVRLIARIVSSSLTRQKTEHQLRDVLGRLERANEELELFASRVSHDLRAPLRNIKQLSNWVVEDDAENLSEESRTHLELIQERIGLADQMIIDLLDYARAGRAVRSEPVDLGELIDECILATTRASDTEYKFDVTVDCGEYMLPKAPMRSILFNLLENACRHHQGGEIKIKIDCSCVAGWVEISVDDNGAGVLPEHRATIFDIFQRYNSSGTGLGLAMARKTAQAHGGTLTLEDKEPPGARFLLRWPRASSYPK